jgi:primosomal protein N' (replication factor Y)
MSEFCDVALPVPLDAVFTYRVPPGMGPVVGGRVLVPFRQQRMSGIVVEVHDRAPNLQTKNVISVLDAEPALDQLLLGLGKWIAGYYLAPIGDVLRTMLPLNAEFQRTITYRITETGAMALHYAGTKGSSGRARRTPEEQLIEMRVLDYLLERDPAPERSLRSATRASRSLLAGMVRKKWLAREDVSAARDAARTVKIAELRGAEEDAIEESTSQAGARRPAPPRTNKINANQHAHRDPGRGRWACAGRNPARARPPAQHAGHAGPARPGHAG